MFGSFFGKKYSELISTVPKKPQPAKKKAETINQLVAGGLLSPEQAETSLPPAYIEDAKNTLSELLQSPTQTLAHIPTEDKLTTEIANTTNIPIVVASIILEHALTDEMYLEDCEKNSTEQQIHCQANFAIRKGFVLSLRYLLTSQQWATFFNDPTLRQPLLTYAISNYQFECAELVMTQEATLSQYRNKSDPYSGAYKFYCPNIDNPMPNINLIHFLLKHNFFPTNLDGFDALERAAIAGDVPVFNLLLQAKANPIQEADENETLLSKVMGIPRSLSGSNPPYSKPPQNKNIPAAKQSIIKFLLQHNLAFPELYRHLEKTIRYPEKEAAYAKKYNYIPAIVNLFEHHAAAKKQHQAFYAVWCDKPQNENLAAQTRRFLTTQAIAMPDNVAVITKLQNTLDDAKLDAKPTADNRCKIYECLLEKITIFVNSEHHKSADYSFHVLMFWLQARIIKHAVWLKPLVHVITQENTILLTGPIMNEHIRFGALDNVVITPSTAAAVGTSISAAITPTTTEPQNNNNKIQSDTKEPKSQQKQSFCVIS